MAAPDVRDRKITNQQEAAATVSGELRLRLLVDGLRLLVDGLRLLVDGLRHLNPGAVRTFAYRLVRPAFVPATVVAAGTRTGNQITVEVAARGALPSLTASITLT